MATCFGVFLTIFRPPYRYLIKFNVKHEGESNENPKYLYKYKLLRFSFDSPSYNLF